MKMFEAFWENEHRIFGLHEIEEDGSCACGNPRCEAQGKHPKIKSWQKVPVWSDEQFYTFKESGSFDSGYGVLCNGLIVIDVDARNGGVDSFRKLSEKIPDIMGAGLVVNTGSGGGSQHFFFKNPSNKPLKSHHKDYEGIDFKSSGFVVGCGSTHKSGMKYELAFGEVGNIDDAPPKLIELLEVKDMHRVVMDGSAIDFGNDDIVDMLSHINPDCDYDKWVSIGMAIHHATDGAGLELWDRWSANGEKYKGCAELDAKWYTFGKSASSVTIGTIIHYAEEAGWTRSVTFETDEFINEPDVIEVPKEKGSRVTKELTLNVDDVDIRRPPDFVGEVAKWINDQCNYKRENLAVAAALTAVSNAGGMRLYDAETNMHANLYSVCVAGSGTGKNSILGAIKKLAIASGTAQALCGGIKSEQEIYRNLLRNQAAHYTIDEVGDILHKVSKANKNGGAPYLDAVIATLLTAYSSVGDSLLITGDLKKEIKDEIKKELKAQIKALENNESKNPAKTEARIANLEKQLSETDCGIEDPFISLFGLTTPVGFDDFMDYKMCTNGFIARTLIFRESDNNPKYKPVSNDMRKVPPRIEAEMMRLYTNGHYEDGDTRVECKGVKSSITTTKKAREMLDNIRDVYFWNMSEEHDEKTGLASVPRRGAEITEKISLILALSSGIRTVEHVRYAFALAKYDIDLKLKVAHANDNKTASGLLAKVLSLLDKRKGMSLGVIANRCRKYKRDDVAKALEKLEEEKKVKSTEDVAKNGQKTTRYKLS